MRSHLEVRIADRVFIAAPHCDIIVNNWEIHGDEVVQVGVYDVQPWSNARKRAFVRKVRRLLWVRRFARLIGADPSKIVLPEPWGGEVCNNMIWCSAVGISVRIVHDFSDEVD